MLLVRLSLICWVVGFVVSLRPTPANVAAKKSGSDDEWNFSIQGSCHGSSFFTKCKSHTLSSGKKVQPSCYVLRRLSGWVGSAKASGKAECRGGKCACLVSPGDSCDEHSQCKYGVCDPARKVCVKPQGRLKEDEACPLNSAAADAFCAMGLICARDETATPRDAEASVGRCARPAEWGVKCSPRQFCALEASICRAGFCCHADMSANIRENNADMEIGISNGAGNACTRGHEADIQPFLGGAVPVEDQRNDEKEIREHNADLLADALLNRGD